MRFQLVTRRCEFAGSVFERLEHDVNAANMSPPPPPQHGRKGDVMEQRGSVLSHNLKSSPDRDTKINSQKVNKGTESRVCSFFCTSAGGECDSPLAPAY